MLSRFLLIYSLLLPSLNLWAASSTSLPVDTVNIGKQGSTSNKSVKFSGTTQEIRANTTTNKLEYSNDGANYKPIGSGTGAGSSTGVNLVSNDSFEDPISTGWTSSGATFSQQAYTNGIESDAKYFRFVATTSGQYFETTALVIPDNFSGGCQADFKKVNVSTDDLFKVEVVDGSANILTSANIKKSSWVKFPTLSFKCPSAGATVKMRVTSLAAGTLEGDRGYVGSNQNLVSIAQAKSLGKIELTGTTGCAFDTTSTSYVSHSANASCGTFIASSANVKIPATKIPGFILPAGSPAGTYQIIARGNFKKIGTTDGAVFFRLTDGTTPFGYASTYVQSQNGANSGNLVGSITYASPLISDTTIQLQSLTETASNTARIELGSANYLLQFEVFYFPSSAESAISNEQSSWFIDANIGGANIGSGVSALTSYTELTDAGLDLVVNSSKGSSNAEIACINGTASSGLTCSGVNESAGIAFVPPYTGSFEACASFSTNISNGNTGTFQLIETPNNASTILQEGGDRITAGISMTTGTVDAPFKVCGNFNFSDTSKKTIRLMIEKPVGNALLVTADRNSSAGQRDIHFTVRPLLSAFNRPILTGDQVTTPGAIKPVEYRARVNGAGTCDVTATLGNAWLTLNTRTTVNDCTFNLVSGKFASGTTPFCTCGTSNAVGYQCDVSGTSSTVRTYVLRHDGVTGTDQLTTISCLGVAP